MLRDHLPVKFGFNGLWKRGDEDTCPLDHFTDCDNIKFAPGAVQTRPGIELSVFGTEALTFNNVVRQYTFNQPEGQSILILDTGGNIYDSGSPTPHIAILTIVGMEDFTFVAVAGRAYLSPIVHLPRVNGGTDSFGMEDEFVYVYLGDGSPARQAAGDAPVGTAMVGANGDTTDVKLAAGIHIIAVSYLTNTGFRTKPGPVDAYTVFTATGAHKLDLSNIPTSPDSFVVGRIILVSKTINPVDYAANPNPIDYELFIYPGGTINDNSTTTFDDIDYYDSELLDSAAVLNDLLGEIPAVANLTTYHERVVASNHYGVYDADPDLDTSYLPVTIRVSNKGEPEAFNDVTGVIQAPNDGYPITCCQEYRDILYVFKASRTYSYNDNGDDPSTWGVIILDQGSGASLHGVATVLDSGGINVDFLMLVNYNGIMLFTGTYIKPEFTWKIETDWFLLERSEFWKIQLVNDTLTKQIFVVLPNNKILLGDYSEKLDELSVKWAYWSFTSPLEVTTLSLIDTNKLSIGFKEL